MLVGHITPWTLLGVLFMVIFGPADRKCLLQSNTVLTLYLQWDGKVINILMRYQQIIKYFAYAELLYECICPCALLVELRVPV